MSLDADLLIDRGRLKRRLTLWRGLAVLLAVAGLWLAFGRDSTIALPGRDQVSRLVVRGFIGEDRRLMRALDALGRDRHVRAVIISIDSPGGSVGGGEALHAALARLRAQGKPLVAVMHGTAASAGYMVALPAERIFAREATVTGSIGVLLQTFEASELLARLGVTALSLTSGPLKDQPSHFRPLTEEGRAALSAVVADLHDQFVGMVVAGRGMEEARVRTLADGRIYSGRQALGLGLVDAIGGEHEARAWLAASHNVPETLPVRDVEIRSVSERLFGSLFDGVAKILVSEWLGVDGFRLLWQPGR